MKLHQRIRAARHRHGAPFNLARECGRYKYLNFLSQPETERQRAILEFDDGKAIVAGEPVSGGTPAEAERLGLKYFPEVSVAREFLEAWTSALAAEPSLRAQVERVIRHAINDA